MKKRLSTPTVQDQDLPPNQHQDSRSSKPTPSCARPRLATLRKQESASYTSPKKPRLEPLELPRLFIQGHGGSIKMDLHGVGVQLSGAVFAHMVADDSLNAVHVCRGDIALVEPAFHNFRDGNLILVDLDGRPSLRRLRKKGANWMLDLSEQISAEPTILANQSILGVVIGFVRLYNELKPIRYKGTETNLRANLEKSAQQGKSRQVPRQSLRGSRGTEKNETEAHPRRYLASEGKHQFCLNDFDDKARYKA